LSSYPRQYLLIVRNADKATANTRMASIDPDTGGVRTFDAMPMVLASNPAGATVAWGCITRATLGMVAKYASDAADLTAAQKLAIYRLDNGEWTVASALADTTKKAAALTFKPSTGVV
jgi:hypothetical protein